MGITVGSHNDQPHRRRKERIARGCRLRCAFIVNKVELERQLAAMQSLDNAL